MEHQVTANGKKITINTGNFIFNRFQLSESGKTFDTIDPATGRVICQVSQATEKDVETAVKSAKIGLKSWQALSCFEKSDLLFKISEILKENLEDLAAIEALDQGKPFESAKKFDAVVLYQYFKYYAGWCDKLNSTAIPNRNNILQYTKYEPYGVTASIVAWNYPLFFVGLCVAASLAAGNVMIFKASQKTPLSTLYFAKLIQNILPPGVLQIVNGEGETVGSALALHMDIRQISFIGSTQVGKKIMEMAAKSNLKRVILELSGKSPNIICKDADLKSAIPSAALGIFGNTGQMCIACSRIYVQEDIYDLFLQKFIGFTKTLEIGDQWKKKQFYIGPVVDQEQYDRVREYIKIGVKEGATIHGEIPSETPEGNGYYIKPVIFADVQNHMRIAQEEIFGPVAVVIKFKTISEVIDKANDSHYGLGCSIFSTNINTCLKVTNEVESGQVWVNNILFDAYDFNTSFGGYKQSGFGKISGEEGLKEWCRIKSVKIKISNIQ